MGVDEKAGDSISGGTGMGEVKNKAEIAVRKWLAEREYDYEVRTYMPDGGDYQNILIIRKWNDKSHKPSKVLIKPTST